MSILTFYLVSDRLVLGLKVHPSITASAKLVGMAYKDLSPCVPPPSMGCEITSTHAHAYVDSGLRPV